MLKILIFIHLLFLISCASQKPIIKEKPVVQKVPELIYQESPKKKTTNPYFIKRKIQPKSAARKIKKVPVTKKPLNVEITIGEVKLENPNK